MMRRHSMELVWFAGQSTVQGSGHKKGSVRPSAKEGVMFVKARGMAGRGSSGAAEGKRGSAQNARELLPLIHSLVNAPGCGVDVLVPGEEVERVVQARHRAAHEVVRDADGLVAGHWRGGVRNDKGQHAWSKGTAGMGGQLSMMLRAATAKGSEIPRRGQEVNQGAGTRTIGHAVLNLVLGPDVVVLTPLRARKGPAEDRSVTQQQRRGRAKESLRREQQQQQASWPLRGRPDGAVIDKNSLLPPPTRHLMVGVVFLRVAHDRVWVRLGTEGSERAGR